YRSYLYSRLISEELRNLPPGYLWLGETNINFDTFGDRAALRFLQAASVTHIMGNTQYWKKASDATQNRMRTLGLVSRIGSIPNDTAATILQEKMGREKYEALLAL